MVLGGFDVVRTLPAPLWRSGEFLQQFQTDPEHRAERLRAYNPGDVLHPAKPSPPVAAWFGRGYVDLHHDVLAVQGAVAPGPDNEQPGLGDVRCAPPSENVPASVTDAGAVGSGQAGSPSPIGCQCRRLVRF